VTSLISFLLCCVTFTYELQSILCANMYCFQYSCAVLFTSIQNSGWITSHLYAICTMGLSILKLRLNIFFCRLRQCWYEQNTLACQLKSKYLLEYSWCMICIYCFFNSPRSNSKVEYVAALHKCESTLCIGFEGYWPDCEILWLTDLQAWYGNVCFEWSILCRPVWSCDSFHMCFVAETKLIV